MKRSEELLGLSIISIEDGKEVGSVSDLVINPAKGTVEYLLVDNGLRHLGVKILPFKLVEGVGEYAVTIQNSSSVTDLASESDVTGLLEQNVRVKGTKVLTKKGKLIGTVSEFLVDDNNEGKIAGCELAPADASGNKGIIPADQIITFGKDVLVVNEGAEGSLTDSVEGSSSATAVKPPEKKLTSPKDDTEKKTPGQQEPSEAARLFEERQREYLLGRKVSKRIETDSGEVIAEEGDLITEELLDKAKTAGKFAELSMNSKA